MVSPDLSNERKDELAEFFSGVFTKTGKSRAPRMNVQQQINTGYHASIKQRGYRVSLTKRRIICEEVYKTLDKTLCSGYWQIEADCEEMALITPEGSYELKSHAVSTLQCTCDLRENDGQFATSFEMDYVSL
ncbi:hypothetical protein AVEN_229211-1 [Araneus ventricosus]|uniref:Uncharacterized protein n=1 Tax=Araneus ventricosus TaxID=182803 RepID=A0A4Y2S825_ARAVE|nr:hypothetical protein AVEN_229211-1 [Araneus ventricosus]